MVVGVVWVCGVKTRVRVMRKKKGCESRWESVLWFDTLTRWKQDLITGPKQLQRFTRMPQYLSFYNLKSSKICS